MIAGLPPGVRALVFDFDGTLADAYSGIAASVNHVRGLHGLPALSDEQVKLFVGRGVEWLLENTVPGCDIPFEVNRYREHHPSVMVQGTHLLPGAGELLSAARRAGVKTAVCSNKRRAFTVELLRHLGIADRIDAVLGPDDVPRPKPAPDMLLAALQRLGVRADETIYIGDMVVDVQAARAAGIRVFGVATGSQHRADLAAAAPDRMMNSLADLL